MSQMDKIKDNNEDYNKEESIDEDITCSKSDSFRMYYALGPGIDQNSILDSMAAEGDIKNSESTTNIETDINSRRNSQNTEITQTIPPDVVASANKIRIITQEPRKLVNNNNNVSFDNRDDPVHATSYPDMDSRDYTSMQRQMDAYKNLEDLLDVPWEESDLSPPTKVDVVLRVGGEIGERYNNM